MGIDLEFHSASLPHSHIELEKASGRVRLGIICKVKFQVPFPSCLTASAGVFSVLPKILRGESSWRGGCTPRVSKKRNNTRSTMELADHIAAGGGRRILTGNRRVPREYINALSTRPGSGALIMMLLPLAQDYKGLWLNKGAFRGCDFATTMLKDNTLGANQQAA